MYTLRISEKSVGNYSVSNYNYCWNIIILIIQCTNILLLEYSYTYYVMYIMYIMYYSWIIIRIIIIRYIYSNKAEMSQLEVLCFSTRRTENTMRSVYIQYGTVTLTYIVYCFYWNIIIAVI